MFQAVWSFATAKDGSSTFGLRRAMEISSYQTAWAMLHRLRSVRVRPGRELLTGTVEVDETYIGGEEPGLAGGRAKGKKALVVVAVEVKDPKGFGRCRMRIITDALAATVRTFIVDTVALDATVVTDGWSGYLGIDKTGYVHDRRSQRAAKARGTPSTLPDTWTSSASGSTVAAPPAAAWCFCASCSSRSATTPSAPASSSSAPGRPRSRRGRPAQPGTRPASTALTLTALGEALTSTSPVRWRALNVLCRLLRP